MFLKSCYKYVKAAILKATLSKAVTTIDTIIEKKCILQFCFSDFSYTLGFTQIVVNQSSKYFEI